MNLERERERKETKTGNKESRERMVVMGMQRWVWKCGERGRRYVVEREMGFGHLKNNAMGMVAVGDK